MIACGYIGRYKKPELFDCQMVFSEILFCRMNSSSTIHHPISLNSTPSPAWPFISPSSSSPCFPPPLPPPVPDPNPSMGLNSHHLVSHNPAPHVTSAVTNCVPHQNAEAGNLCDRSDVNRMCNPMTVNEKSITSLERVRSGGKSKVLSSPPKMSVNLLFQDLPQILSWSMKDT